MDETTRCSIRYIFLTPRPSVALLTAAEHLGMSLKELKQEIEDGAIVAVSTRMGVKVSKEELMAAAMRFGSRRSSKRLLGMTRRPCCRRQSGWWSCGRGCRGISGRCYGSWRGWRGRPSI